MKYKSSGKSVYVRYPYPYESTKKHVDFELFYSDSDEGMYIYYQDRYWKIVPEDVNDRPHPSMSSYVVKGYVEPTKKKLMRMVSGAVMSLIPIAVVVNIFGWLFFGWPLSELAALVVAVAGIAAVGTYFKL